MRLNEIKPQVGNFEYEPAINDLCLTHSQTASILKWGYTFLSYPYSNSLKMTERPLYNWINCIILKTVIAINTESFKMCYFNFSRNRLFVYALQITTKYLLICNKK